jgi:hypothetical protein
MTNLIRDVFITAIEGGIGYWAANVRCFDKEGKRVSYADPSWVFVTGEDVEYPEDKFQFDFGLFSLTAKKSGIDLENHDIEDADIIVQKAAFGEIVYS